MGKALRRTIAVFCVLSLIISVKVPIAAANDTSKINIEVSFGQTEARAMLDMINEFRLSGNAWQYDENNNRIAVTGLGRLVYDYELEQTAMQRAAEIAVSFSHTRPNGESCFTAYSSYWAAGENIAAGYPTGASVFEAWKEENEPYSGQGHRRNMLSSGFTAVGIGHIRYNGTDYWVQEFREPAVNTTPTKANDSNAVVPVEISNNRIQTLSLSSVQKTISLEEGETADLMNVEATVVLTSGKTVRYSDAPVKWSSSNASVAKVDGDRVEGIKEGSAVLTGSLSLGSKTAQIQITVNVVRADFDDPVLGDVNSDNAVNAQDLTVLARHLAKIQILADARELKAADTDRDGIIDASDLTTLAKYVAKIIPAL